MARISRPSPAEAATPSLIKSSRDIRRMRRGMSRKTVRSIPAGSGWHPGRRKHLHQSRHCYLPDAAFPSHKTARYSWHKNPLRCGPDGCKSRKPRTTNATEDAASAKNRARGKRKSMTCFRSVYSFRYIVIPPFLSFDHCNIRQQIGTADLIIHKKQIRIIADAAGIL